MKNQQFDSDRLVEIFEEYQWVRYTFYAAGAVIGIWLLGKASKLLSDAVVNFKSLNNALKY